MYVYASKSYLKTFRNKSNKMYKEYMLQNVKYY